MLACVATSAEAQEVDQRHLECIAHAVYGESRDEPLEGQYAVAWSVIFRAQANRPYFGGRDICDVVYKRRMTANGTERWEYDGAKVPITDEDAMRNSLEVAYWTLMGQGQPSEPVTYFCAPYACGGWHDRERKLSHVGTIGGHKFYVDTELHGPNVYEASGE